MKAVLAKRDVPYPRTHDLTRLIDLLREAGLELPDWLEDADRLTRYAVVERYEQFAMLDEPLNRDDTLDLVTRTREWAERVVPEA